MTDTEIEELIGKLEAKASDGWPGDATCVSIDDVRSVLRECVQNTTSPPHDPLAPSTHFDPDARLAARPDMPRFVLIAQDNLAAGLVEQWAIQSKQSGKCPHEKTTDAFNIAEQMRRWPIHKDPD